MPINDGFVCGKNLYGKLLENTLRVSLKLYESVWYSFYCNISRIISFRMFGDSAFKIHVTVSVNGFLRSASVRKII
jgi:hypothetical protein